jgi:RNA polymerase sigma-70 factor, ECF subfamily
MRVSSADVSYSGWDRLRRAESSVVTEISAADPDLDRACRGDGEAFARLVGPVRPELHAHCYRMLGSTHDADDALQDALVRAWRGLAGLRDAAALRSWLYTVATRACLDAIDRRGRRALPVDLGPANPAAELGSTPVGEVAWLEPYPSADLPAGRYEQREAVELAFVAALQHLPGNQRAALLLVEVLGFAPVEIAAMMETSVASVNSALQRARRIVATKVPAAGQQRTLRTLGDARLREIAGGYADALERGDADALVALLTEDVTWSMPPLAEWYAGRPDVMAFAVKVPLTDCGAWRHRFTEANGQPAVASYLDRGDGYEPWSIDVLTIRDDRIAAVTSFIGAHHFPAFDLSAAPD